MSSRSSWNGSPRPAGTRRLEERLICARKVDDEGREGKRACRGMRGLHPSNPSEGSINGSMMLDPPGCIHDPVGMHLPARHRTDRRTRALHSLPSSSGAARATAKA